MLLKVAPGQHVYTLSLVFSVYTLHPTCPVIGSLFWRKHNQVFALDLRLFANWSFIFKDKAECIRYRL